MKGQKDERHQARKVALATIYCIDSAQGNVQECTDLSTENLNIREDEWDSKMAEDIIRGVATNKKPIDKIIRECAPQWPLDKIFKIDLVILEMAVFELLFQEEVPEKVILDEAIELAKEFGNEASSKFVNGVLGTILDNKEKYVPKGNTKTNHQ